MTKKYEHTECPTCGAGLYLDPEPHCRECLITEQAEEIGRLNEELARLRKDPPIDWQRVRIDAAIAVAQGMYANSLFDGTPEDAIAKMATHQADALIAELQKEVAK